MLAMSVPKDRGGMGLDTSTYVMVLEEIAKGCINTAMTLHMHSTVMKFIAALATPEQMKRLFSTLRLSTVGSCLPVGAASPLSVWERHAG